MWTFIGIIVCSIVLAASLAIWWKQRSTAKKLKKLGNVERCKQYRRDSWIMVVWMLGLLVGLLWLIHPAIIFDHIGL